MAVADGKIVAVGPDLGMEAAKVIDASGKHVMPGWTDIHTCAPWSPNIDMSAASWNRPTRVEQALRHAVHVGPAAPAFRPGRRHDSDYGQLWSRSCPD